MKREFGNRGDFIGQVAAGKLLDLLDGDEIAAEEVELSCWQFVLMHGDPNKLTESSNSLKELRQMQAVSKASKQLLQALSQVDLKNAATALLRSEEFWRAMASNELLPLHGDLRRLSDLVDDLKILNAGAARFATGKRSRRGPKIRFGLTFFALSLRQVLENYGMKRSTGTNSKMVQAISLIWSELHLEQDPRELLRTAEGYELVWFPGQKPWGISDGFRPK